MHPFAFFIGWRGPKICEKLSFAPAGEWVDRVEISIRVGRGVGVEDWERIWRGTDDTRDTFALGQ